MTEQKLRYSAADDPCTQLRGTDTDRRGKMAFQADEEAHGRVGDELRWQ